jgi:hypothetical protein
MLAHRAGKVFILSAAPRRDESLFISRAAFRDDTVCFRRCERASATAI